MYFEYCGTFQYFSENWLKVNKKKVERGNMKSKDQNFVKFKKTI